MSEPIIHVGTTLAIHCPYAQVHEYKYPMVSADFANKLQRRIEELEKELEDLKHN